MLRMRVPITRCEADVEVCLATHPSLARLSVPQSCASGTADPVAAPIRWRDRGDCSFGLSTWAQVLERGYEGLVGKDEASPYREGRALSWLKVKQPRYREGERGWEPQKS